MPRCLPSGLFKPSSILNEFSGTRFFCVIV